MSPLLAVDDGIFQGNFNLADICFLTAVILFVIGAIIAFQVKTLYATLISAGLAAVALGLLVL
jgi:hypothetical protein